MATLHLIRPQLAQEPLTVDELLALLGPDKLNAIDAKAKLMREHYPCPYTVPNYDAFKETLVGFYTHYHTAFYGDPGQATKTPGWKELAYDFAQQHLGGHNGIRTAERNAITGREGGMISVIDTLTEAITKVHTENYVRAVFFDTIAPSDYDTRLRLANEILNRYGRFLFPGEELLPHYVLGMNLEAFINGFVTHLHALRRDWRY